MALLYWLPCLLYAVAIFSLSHMSSPPGAGIAPDYVAHFIEYGLFSLTAFFALTRGFRQPIGIRTVAGIWIGVTLFGVTDEVHQFFVPGRSSSLQDVASDSLGALCFLAVGYLIIRSKPIRCGRENV